MRSFALPRSRFHRQRPRRLPAERGTTTLALCWMSTMPAFGARSSRCQRVSRLHEVQSHCTSEAHRAKRAQLRDELKPKAITLRRLAPSTGAARCLASTFSARSRARHVSALPGRGRDGQALGGGHWKVLRLSRRSGRATRAQEAFEPLGTRKKTTKTNPLAVCGVL